MQIIMINIMKEIGRGKRNDVLEGNYGAGITDTSKDKDGNNLKERMEGKSLNHSTGEIDYADLVYLQIPHYDFNGNVTTGEMVVNKAVADEVLLIFEKLYQIKYPIDKMVLVDQYYPGNSDFQSIEDNNTSAFNERTTDSGNPSNHAKGLAIDINPIINPMIYTDDGRYSTHKASAPYVEDRIEMTNWDANAKAACINPQTEIYKIFTSYGWRWLGNDDNTGDTQHFDKQGAEDSNTEQIDWSNADESNGDTKNKKKKDISLAEVIGGALRNWWEAMSTFFENLYTGREEQGIIFSLGDTEPIKKVLFIGNSRTNVNNIPGLFSDLSNSLGKNVIVNKVLKDAQPLSNFLDKEELFADLSSKVKERSWDYVVLQEQTETSMNSDVVTNSTKRIIDYIKQNSNSNINPIYKAWGIYNDFNEIQYNQAIQSFESAKSQNGGDIAYIANAFLKCHERYPEINLYYDDRHATIEGSYLATCCIFAAIFDEATEGASFISTCSQDNALKLQKIADEVMGVTGKFGKRTSSNSVVEYATSWAGKVRYVLRK